MAEVVAVAVVLAPRGGGGLLRWTVWHITLSARAREKWGKLGVKKLHMLQYLGLCSPSITRLTLESGDLTLELA